MLESTERVSERVNRLRERYLTTIPRLDAERALLVTRSYQETEGEPMVIRRAKALAKVMNEMTIFIADDELIVGNQAKSYRGAAVFPEYTLEWFYRELEDGSFQERTTATEKFLFSEEDIEAIYSIRDYWQKNHFGYHMLKSAPEGTEEVVSAGVLSFMWPDLVVGSVGHFIPNYEKLLAKGFSGIKKEAEEHLARLGIRKNGNDINKYYFLKAVTILCDAVSNFGNRYAALARELAANEGDTARKVELLQIASNCAWVPANPARTFWEACQSVWFGHMLIMLDANHPGQSFGRFDQIMYPYYMRDKKAGRINALDAQELVDCFWIKISETNKLKNIISTKNTSGYSMGQNVTIGGQTRDGRDATNDITYMCLRAQARLKVHEPSLSIRIWDGTPDKLWQEAIETTKIVGGLPSFQNDEIIIPQLINSGVALEDARDYGIVGCVEPSPTGNAYPCCGGPGSATYLNIAQCLMYALTNGLNPITGKKTGLQVGDLSSYQSFEEIKEAYVKQVHYFADWYVTLTNTWHIVNAQIMPLPLLSCLMEPCVQKGVDITAGGAQYNFTGLGGVGASNVADALAAVKKFVFDDKEYSGAELLDAILTNWEGKEALRNEIIAGAPKFGNDDPYVDELARWSMAVFCDRINQATAPTGTYRAGLWPVSINVLLGSRTGATLDGRRAGEPLADGISPRQGMDKHGPTAVFKSAAALDHFKAGNGTLLNMKFHPNAVKGIEGTEKLKNLIQSYFDMKGMHVQLNVVSAETLREAQKNPEKHRDLVVRVAGYSAYFVELYKELQDDIIARTEHI